MAITITKFIAFVQSSVAKNPLLRPMIVFLIVLYGHQLLAQTADSLFQDLPSVEIVATTPLAGSSLDRNNVPSTIQSISAKQLRQQGTMNFTDVLNEKLGSVHLNFANGNSLQPDLNYRGFTASPVLGISQGVAVFQDGVRLNESFGNVVNWDVIPTFALENVELMSGSNPIFGLNALGGALSLRTKSGFSSPEKMISIEGGSFGRLHTTAEMGGNNGKLGYYIGGDFFRETGWRDFSPSRVGRAFGKMSWISGKNTVHISGTVAQSQLHGNGPAPVELLKTNRRAIFSHPDITENQLNQLNAQWTRDLSKNWQLQTVAYGKWMNNRTLNGDVSPYVACNAGQYKGFLCEEPEKKPDGTLIWTPILDANNQPIRATDANNSAIINSTNTRQLTFGATAQLTSNTRFFNKSNHFTLGLSLDAGNAQFGSNVELGKITPTRGTEGSKTYNKEAEVDLKFEAKHLNLYFLESLSVIDSVYLQISGQLQQSNIQLKDQLGDALNGEHHYLRFNPALGFVWKTPQNVAIYGNYSVSARTPTPVELTCADPAAPCRLPNAFLSDPPLKQAVAQTAEMGARFHQKNMEATATFFRTLVQDDIYFISAGASRNTGYFSNIGNTLRTGVELGYQYHQKNWNIYSNYTFLHATFQESFTIHSPFHPEANDGEIEVKKGNRLPLIPQHIAKMGVTYHFSPNNRIVWLFGTQILMNGSQYVRGDESNTLEKIKGYMVGNLFASCRISPKITLATRIENIWNQQYETFGLLGSANRLPAFEKFNQPFFLTPGAPLAVSVSAKFFL
jgi:iron complex outermembrane recepter protein